MLSSRSTRICVDAVVENVGAVTWTHSLHSLKRGGTIVVNGVATGGTAETDLLRIFVEQIDIRGTIMVTLEEMKAMMSFIITTGIRPEVDAAIPMEKAREAIGSMIAYKGKDRIRPVTWAARSQFSETVSPTSARAQGADDTTVRSRKSGDLGRLRRTQFEINRRKNLLHTRVCTILLWRADSNRSVAYSFLRESEACRVRDGYWA